MSTRTDALTRIIRGEVIDDPLLLEPYSRDTSIFRVSPECAVCPKDPDDIKALVRFANDAHEHGDNLSLTARSAGTDMTGGPLNTGIIIDMSRHFDAIKHVTSESATVLPGVYFRDLERATRRIDRILPSYPASKDLCTIGGMIANNSGGEKTLAYGKTDRYVMRLNAVMADGNEYTFRPLTAAALETKKRDQGFEGELYRRVHALVSNNRKLLAAARPQVSKNSSGYALWDVWDERAGTFDLTKLLVGSQGTLGIVTEAEIALVEPKLHSKLLVIFIDDMTILGSLINTLLETGPESLESYDDHTFKIALRLFPQVVRTLGGNIFKLGLAFLPEFFAVLTGGVPKLVLLAEYTGDSAGEATRRAETAKRALAPFSLKMRLTTNAADAEKYWTVRRESFNLLRQHTERSRSAPFIDDLIVRPEHLPQFLPRLYALLDSYPLMYTIAGHMGDGNFHIIPLMDFTKHETLTIIFELIERVHALIREFHGSNTAEHNDGLLRTPYLETMHGKEMYALFEEVKAIFDPKHIFNPRKKVGGDLAFLRTHIDTAS